MISITEITENDLYTRNRTVIYIYIPKQDITIPIVETEQTSIALSIPEIGQKQDERIIELIVQTGS